MKTEPKATTLRKLSKALLIGAFLLALVEFVKVIDDHARFSWERVNWGEAAIFFGGSLRLCFLSTRLRH